MIVRDWPRDHSNIYQATVCVSTWSWYVTIKPISASSGLNYCRIGHFIKSFFCLFSIFANALPTLIPYTCLAVIFAGFMILKRPFSLAARKTFYLLSSESTCVHNGLTNSNLNLSSYTSALQSFSLFGLKMNRFPGMIGALFFLILYVYIFVCFL
jgi:hypothetical protein